jgi:hypothetical protein
MHDMGNASRQGWHRLSRWRASFGAEGVLMPPAGRTTYWHITEIVDSQDPSHNRSFTVPNDAPRMLRTLAAPYLQTHRVVSSQRRRAGGGASFARFELEPLSDPGTQLVLHALLISLTAIK